GLLAALMSSLSAVFNSCSTLITWDIYKKLKPAASERQLVWVGRMSTGVLVLLGLLWIPLMQNISGQLYQYLQSVQAYIAPPIAAVFLVGIMWKRINSQGAIASLILGFVLGAARLILELANGQTRDGLAAGSIGEVVAEINFLHFAVYLFLICLVALVVVSLLTPAPPHDKVKGLTFATAEESVAGVDRQAISVQVETSPIWRRRDLWLSAGVVLLVAALWMYFSG
ncbi:MAG: Na+/glucose cotransporter, partial [Rhodothermales bacterium]